MTHIRTAVILAAGMGSRIREIHPELPKGFLKLGNQTIIQESIERLIRVGIHKIVIVTGYQNEHYDALMLHYPMIHTVKNDIYSTTGSMHSLLMAEPLVHDDFLLLESDIIYPTIALQALINSKYQDSILLSGATQSGDEVYVGIDQDQIVNMSKNIQDIAQLGGELVGISKISMPLYQKMCALAPTKIKENNNYHYEDCLTDLSSDHVINYDLISDLAWIEIDDKQHYEKAKNIIYPKIQKLESDYQINLRVKRNVLLNPGPATTTDTVKQALVVPDICPRELEFGLLVDNIRIDLTRIVHGLGTHEAVLFASSGTGGVEACLSSVIPPHKSVLVINNGAYGQRMINICNAYQIPCIPYNITYGDAIDLQYLELLIETHHESLSHIAFIHHETTVGILNSISDVSAIAKKYGLEIIVDAMSSYAGIPINVQTLGVDYLISSSNKCIQGMAGISFVICSKEALDKTAAYPRRNFYFNLYDNLQFFVKSHQMQFTPPVQILYALRQAINEYWIETEAGRASRYEEMYRILVDGMERMGFELLVPEPHRARLLTAIVEPKCSNYNFNDMHDYLLARGFTIYPGKGAKLDTFRISNIGQIYPDDIRAFLKTLEEYITLKQIKVKS